MESYEEEYSDFVQKFKKAMAELEISSGNKSDAGMV